MSYDDAKLSAAMNGVEQLKNTVLSEIESLENVENQLGSLAVIVNNFVMQTLQAVSNNEDTASVNEQLANSIIQIKDFVTNRPMHVKNTVHQLEQRLDAYEQCRLILNEASKIELPDSSSKDLASDSRKRKEEAIADALDSSGKYVSRRKPGTRPESLRDIRKVEAAIEAQKNSEEDI